MCICTPRTHRALRMARLLQRSACMPAALNMRLRGQAQVRAVHGSESSQERRVYLDQIDMVFKRLGLDKELCQKVGGIRVRQHVNPLKRDLQVPAAPLAWEEVYGAASRPLVVDVGTGYGRFLLALSRAMPGHNMLGLEVRDQVVERAQKWAEALGLDNQVQFVKANATISLDTMLASYPGTLDLVAIQFPDPHFKRKHRKRRVVQPQLVAALAQLMAPGGRVLLQSDVEEVAVAMRDMFEQYGCQAFALSPQHAPGAVFFSETRQQQQEEEEAGGLAALGADGAEPRAERQEGGGSAEEGPPLGGASGYSSDEESGVEGGGGGLRPEHPADHPGGARSAEQQAGSDGGGAAESMPGEPAMSRTRQELNWWRGGWLAENPLGVPTERELYVMEQGLPVYRVLLVRQ